MLIYKVLSVLGFGYWGLLALCCVCYDRKCILHFPMFGTTKNGSWPKMSHTKQITSNKFHTANVFFFGSFSRLQQNTWKWMIFSKNISIKWVIFQSTSSNEPNRVLVLFFSPLSYFFLWYCSQYYSCALITNFYVYSIFFFLLFQRQNKIFSVFDHNPSTKKF